MKRLEICIDIASGLEFLHGGLLRREEVIHGDITSSNVLLMEDWTAKITSFGHSMISPINQELDYIIGDPTGTMAYCDPLYIETKISKKMSDIYSFGVVLFEILCGLPVYAYHNNQPLIYLVKHHYEGGKLDELMFKGIKEKIGPQSLDTFSRIVCKCIDDDDREKRPTATQVLVELKEALDFQMMAVVVVEDGGGGGVKMMVVVVVVKDGGGCVGVEEFGDDYHEMIRIGVKI
ncbi:putative receptor-like protein kinase At5g39000 [Rutidosis leptorrhynchoides]|uniref:putative receptor-like protein kinase At5g39000 n=1 Tax=Rutidosis leptorrhynchoides TaxID=125765 RepID=UPI003A9A44CA